MSETKFITLERENEASGSITIRVYEGNLPHSIQTQPVDRFEGLDPTKVEDVIARLRSAYKKQGKTVVMAPLCQQIEDMEDPVGIGIESVQVSIDELDRYLRSRIESLGFLELTEMVGSGLDLGFSIVEMDEDSVRVESIPGRDFDFAEFKSSVECSTSTASSVFKPRS